METPVQVAYKALGESFNHPSSVESPDHSTCVRCQDTLPLGAHGVPLLKLISNKFTDWERLTDSSSSSLVCVPCAWAYSVLDNRLRRILVTKSQVYPLSSTKASELLMLSSKVEETTSIVIPVSGKKHVLPYAKWGALSYDDGTLKWNDNLAKSVASVHFLKAAGLSETSLRNKHHYYPPTADPILFFYAWDSFESMNPALLELTLVLSRLLDDKVVTEAFERWAKCEISKR